MAGKLNDWSAIKAEIIEICCFSFFHSLMDNLDKANMSDECKNDMNTFYMDIGGYLDESSSYANHSKLYLFSLFICG